MIVEGKSLTVIDPGTSDAVINFIEQHGLLLDMILVTHHHLDHVGGIEALYKHYPKVKIYGPDIHQRSQSTGLQPPRDTSAKAHSKIPMTALQATGGSELLNGKPWQVMHTPGHTYDHLCYFRDGHLFSADTLFSAGCGRAFTNNPAKLFHSLCKLSEYPNDTLVYPAHEYTLGNLAFAEYIEPENLSIQKHLHHVRRLRDQGLPSLPTSMGFEKKINPFLRCALPSVQDRINKISGKTHDSPESVFITMRALKDAF